MLKIEAEKFLMPRKSIFTERQLEVMQAISNHLNNKAIIRLLKIKDSTLKNHISDIVSKICDRVDINGFNTHGIIEDVYLAIKKELDL